MYDWKVEGEVCKRLGENGMGDGELVVWKFEDFVEVLEGLGRGCVEVV